MYDVAIIGAGPAGATLARLLGRRYRVLLLECRRLDLAPGPGVALKCCGGLLSLAAQEELGKSGLGVPKEILVGPQLFSVRTLDIDNGLERHYQRPYVNLDREKFDRWLVSLIPPGVEVRFGCRLRRLEQQPDRVRIGFSDGKNEYVVEAGLVVGADGAGSPVRRLLGLPAASRRYIAIQERFAAGARPASSFTALFDSSITDFYGWVIPKDGELLAGVALAPGVAADAAFGRFKARLLEKRLIPDSAPLSREGALIIRPQRFADIQTGNGRVLLAGEAAGWISPSTAEGFSFAFRSAALAAQALEAGPKEAAERYRRLTRPLCISLFGKLLKSPAMYWPYLRGLAMGSGLTALTLRPETARSAK
jgi:flavin-dependent dehydrogenase